MGSLSFNLTGTYLIELITDPGRRDSRTFDCAGEFAGTLRQQPDDGRQSRAAHAIAHRLADAVERRSGSDPSLHQRSRARRAGSRQTASIDTLDAEHYFDLFGSWNVTEMAKVRLGINNVLDDDPSINASVGTTGNGNTYPQVYDALGRYIFGGVTVKF